MRAQLRPARRPATKRRRWPRASCGGRPSISRADLGLTCLAATGGQMEQLTTSVAPLYLRLECRLICPLRWLRSWLRASCSAVRAAASDSRPSGRFQVQSGRAANGPRRWRDRWRITGGAHNWPAVSLLRCHESAAIALMNDSRPATSCRICAPPRWCARVAGTCERGRCQLRPV